MPKPSTPSPEPTSSARPLRLAVAGALIDRDGRILLTRRPPGRELAGYWEFPGGKLQDNESPEAALIRELTEELGISTITSCLAPLIFTTYDYGEFHLLMPLFVCRQWDGIPHPAEGQELAWVRPHELREYAMPPANAPLVAALIDLL